MAGQTFALRGQVIDQATKKGLPELQVEAWDLDPQKSDRLGQTTTDPQGMFTISFVDTTFSDNSADPLPDVYVKVFAGTKLIHNSKAKPLQDWTSQSVPLRITVNLQLAEGGDEGKDELALIEGEVVTPDGAPLQNYRLRAFDRVICDWRSLGQEARTNDFGRYSIRYNPAQLTAPKKARADLKVEVYDPTGDTVVAVSPLILQALPKEILNFVVGKDSYRGPSDYSRVQQALAPLLPSPIDWNCLELMDVLILARESQLPTSSVAYYVKAQRWGNTLQAPSEIFYGLLDGKHPAQLDALLARPFLVLWATLEAATAQNVINIPMNEASRLQLARLQQRYLAQPNHPYRKLLGTTTLSSEQQATFTQRLTTGTQTGDMFWQSLETEAGFSREQVADVRATFELQALTGENTSLSTYLRTSRNVRLPREAAALSLEQWQDEVLTATGVTIPDDILPGKPEATRRAAYAEMLYRNTEDHYQTASLAAQMGRSAVWAQHPLRTFLTTYPDFEFSSQHISYFLQEHPEALKLFSDPVAGKQDLLRMEQLFHLTSVHDRLTAIQPLWDAGLRSAPQIATAGRQRLLRLVGKRLPKAEMQRIYHKAVHTTAVALNVYLRYHPRLNGLSLYALRAPQLPQEQAVARAATDLPEWEELFGSSDACECSHCQSALSPAAYLVDMMDFLQRATDSTGKTALEYLLERRPDLGTLQLTCDNTETELPHIDLVTEIMEQIVAHSEDGTTYPAVGIQPTTWESELLTAQPEHLEPAAYDKLRVAVYPFPHLPFDLWLEEGRRYLTQMNIGRADLMRLMPPHAGVGAVEIATEALGMSTREREIIQKPTAQEAQLSTYWGLGRSARSLDKLRNVEVLLKQARLEYDTLLQLLNTRYLNPKRLIAVTFTGQPCTLAGAIFTDQTGMPVPDAVFLAFIDRLHRFLRLQQRLEWTAYELDTMLVALSVSDFNVPSFLPKFADLQTLRTTLNLPVSEFCSWWGKLDTYAFEEDVPSQYEEIFLDLSVFPDTHSGTGPDLRNKVFALRPDRADLAITVSIDATLSRWIAESDGASTSTYVLEPDYAIYLQSATQLTAEDLLLLVTEVLPKDATTGHVALNLANVSLLYRISSVTRALKISISDYLLLLRLTGLAPLTTATRSASPGDSLALYTRLGDINAGAWSIAELAYLLLHDDEAVVTYGPKPEDIETVLDTASAAFVGISTLKAAKDNAELKTGLAQSLGASLGLDAVVLEDVLFTHRPALGDDLLAHLIIAANPELVPPSTPALEFSAVYETLYKFTFVWNRLALDYNALAFILDQGPGLGWTDISKLPLTLQSTARYEAWRRLQDAVRLQASLFTIEQSLFGLLTTARDQSVSRETFLAKTSDWTGWSLADVTYLSGPEGFNYTYPNSFLDEQWLVSLDRVFTSIQPLGVAAAQVHPWTTATLTFAETESIKQSLALAYDHDQWLTVLTVINDALRPLKRDALLGVLLDRLSATDSAEFYRHYLIDPDMDPCARTSRIVAAHAAVQLFAQRVLMNLEAPLAFAREDAEAWQWRKNYRVWEAARKVFLYPENWLEPEWRDNKSVFFKDLEDGLLQAEVNQETAERLYREYLTKLDAASHLEIMGMYQDEATNVLHVFGRAHDISTVYYYRRWEDQARWTPWERVDVDIQADHLIPIVYNGRLYLFWPNFKVTEIFAGSSTAQATTLARKLSDYDSDTGTSTPSSGEIPEVDEQPPPNEPEPEKPTPSTSGSTPANEHRYEIELQMAWSQYQSGAWTPKILSTKKIFYTAYDPLRRHYFTGWVSDENRLHLALHINKLGGGTGLTEDYIGYFYFDDCQSQLLFYGADDGEALHPNGEIVASSSLQEYNSLVFGSPTWSITRFELEVASEATPRQLLGKLPEGGQYYYAHQYGLGGSVASPFFFADNARTYFVRLADSASFSLSQTVSSFTATPSVRAISGNSTPVIATLPSSHYGAGTELFISHSNEQQSTMLAMQQVGDLHDVLAADTVATWLPTASSVVTKARYAFERFYHPHTHLFLRQLSRYGVEGLLNPDPDLDEDSENLYRQLTPFTDFSFANTYAPNTGWVSSPYPGETIDFDHSTAYGSYNWELFFHIPLLIATRLMQNQRFSEARRWFHYIFDPTHADGAAPARFWKIQPFYEEQRGGPTDTLQQLLDLLEQGNDALEQQVQEWNNDPLQPHVIARLRMTAYMQTTVMKYLDCLIGEADMLFTMDTRESINEAAQLYVLAGGILGDRPTLLPEQEPTTTTPNILLGRLPVLRSPLDTLTSLLPITLPGIGPSRTSPITLPTVGIHAQGGTTCYGTLLSFCIPHNDKLYAYWDTVADRLFKIRHCMNITGQVRQLPLFAPPIDPGLLIRANAAGLDLASILSNLYAPLPNYRFTYMLQKALEFCGEVRNLGGALLSALEKNDGEALSVLRSTHEVSLLHAIRAVKARSIEEATASSEGLQKSKEAAEQRREYYTTREHVNQGEQKSLDKQEDSRHRQRDAEIAETTASIMHLIPVTIGGTTGIQSSFGGSNLGSAAQAFASYFRARSALHAYEANKAITMAGYTRRQDDWKFQVGVAKKDIEQIDKQILAAEIRQLITEKELENHEQQITQAEEAEAFLKNKFTNQQLYSWMLAKISTLYFQAYQMAYQLAKQAEKAFQHEVGPEQSSTSFILPTYWDSLKKGLLAGEQLHHDLRRMEMSYLEQNKREYEITKHISLSMLDPVALITLRETGKCAVSIPEALFDLDYPGHYLRRLKNVSITLPCITGPYTGVNCTLTLTKSSIRQGNTLLNGVYTRDVANEDSRFTDSFGAIQSIVTSSGQNDTGLFETNLRDERYLPFEGAGVISDWNIELPSEFRAFDYDTISDVILHFRYTAREAGGSLKAQAVSELQAAINDISQTGNEQGLARLFSLRHEFPSDWHRFLNPVGTTAQNTLKLLLTKDRFPFLLQGKSLAVTDFTIYAKVKPEFQDTHGILLIAFEREAKTPSQQTIVDPATGLLQFEKAANWTIPTLPEESQWMLSVTRDSGERLDPSALEEVYVVCHYQIVE